MGREKRWKDACTTGKNGVWMHDVDVTHISFIMSSSPEMYDGSTRRQQAFGLLELCLREQGKNCSHMLCDVAGVGEGTLMVQWGYSSASDDLEVLPSWEVFHIFSSITRGVFDKEHVKEQSFVLTGAYLHELTAFSLGSKDLWVECPQDHFTLDALGEQGGGEDDRVVDRDIYHYDIFFLTWVSKHKED